MKKILILAGEESGVIYANGIADRLRARDAGVEIRGYADYGFATGDLAVFGYWEVLRSILFFLRVQRTMKRAIREWRPDVVCTIDYPGLNLKLAAYAKKLGIRAVHVVCPQVWAWHKGRIPKIERSIDRLCCFLPFEPQIFRPGFATFVGHPLADASVAAKGETVREPKLLALLPGSRICEIERILPRLLAAADLLAIPGLRVEIPAAHEKARRAIEAVLDAHGGKLRPSCTVTVTTGGAVELLRRARCAAVASGTATLQAALALCPTVVVYAVSELLGRFLSHAIDGVKHVGLANVVAEKAGAECPMPELLQWDFTPSATAEILRQWLVDDAAAAQSGEKLASAVERLRSSGDALSNVVETFVMG